jgi:cold shock protein
MANGLVKWFNTDKGFGFIAPADGSPDVFVHRNNNVGLGFGEGLKEGEEVDYEIERTPKGLSAVNVERVGG